MGKMHELLAVEATLKGQADSVVKETIVNFTKKAHLFTGKTRNYQPVDDEGEKFADEDVEMTTTVPDRLKYTFDAMVPALDATYQKEVTNTTAKADVVVNGEVLLENVPAVALLTLETELKKVRQLLVKAPTLEPGKGWTKDEAVNNTWVSKEIVTVKTKKVEDFKVVVQPTDKHPAHVERVVEDKTVGHWHTQDISGEITSNEKHEMLARLDNLLREVKKARARANQVDVVDQKVGKAILDFIQG